MVVIGRVWYFSRLSWDANEWWRKHYRVLRDVTVSLMTSPMTSQSERHQHLQVYNESLASALNKHKHKHEQTRRVYTALNTQWRLHVIIDNWQWGLYVNINYKQSTATCHQQLTTHTGVITHVIINNTHTGVYMSSLTAWNRRRPRQPMSTARYNNGPTIHWLHAQTFMIAFVVLNVSKLSKIPRIERTCSS